MNAAPFTARTDEPDLPRDVLAAIAMHALLSNPAIVQTNAIAAAIASVYELADRVLAARTAK